MKPKKTFVGAISKIRIILLSSLALIILSALGLYFQDKIQKDKYKVTNPIASSVSSAYEMQSSEVIKCVRTSPNVHPGVVYIKNDAIYFEGGHIGILTLGSASGLYKNNTIWVWAPKDKKGTKITLNDSPDELNKFIHGFDDKGFEHSCEYSQISESVFNPPSNVNFDEQ